MLSALISSAGVVSTKVVGEAWIIRVRERLLKMDCGKGGLWKQEFGFLPSRVGRERGVSFMEMIGAMVLEFDASIDLD